MIAISPARGKQILKHLWLKTWFIHLMKSFFSDFEEQFFYKQSFFQQFFDC